MGAGGTVDFKNTVVIMTSNVGSHFVAERAQRGETAIDEGVRRQLLDSMRQHFKPEFLNRVDDIIFFHALDRGDIRRIIDIQLAALLKRLEDRKIHLTLTEAARDQIIEEGYDPVYGARPLKRTIQRRVLDPLALAVLQGQFNEGDVDRSGCRAGRVDPAPCNSGDAGAGLTKGMAERMNTPQDQQPGRRPVGARPHALAPVACGRRAGTDGRRQRVFHDSRQRETIQYSQFKQLLAENRVDDLLITTDTIRGKYQKPDKTLETFATVRVEDPKLVELLEAKGVRYEAAVDNRWIAEVLSWVLPILLLLGLWMFFFRPDRRRRRRHHVLRPQQGQDFPR
jgi:hypothetical protein